MSDILDRERIFSQIFDRQHYLQEEIDTNSAELHAKVSVKERKQIISHLKMLITLEKGFLIHSILSAAICLSIRLGYLSNQIEQENSFAFIRQQQPHLRESFVSSHQDSSFDYYVLCFIQNILCIYLLPYIIQRDSQMLGVLISALKKTMNQESSSTSEPQIKCSSEDGPCIKHEVEVLEAGVMKQQQIQRKDQITLSQVIEAFTRTESFGSKLMVGVSTIALLGFNIAAISGGVINQEIENYVIFFLALPALIIVVPSMMSLISLMFNLIGIIMYCSIILLKITLQLIEDEYKIMKRKMKIKYSKYHNHKEDSICPICIDDYDQSDSQIAILPCFHTFHRSCIHMWIKEAGHCPICRKLIA